MEQFGNDIDYNSSLVIEEEDAVVDGDGENEGDAEGFRDPSKTESKNGISKK